MNWYEYYLIFAVATALTGLYELIIPVVRVLRGTNPELLLVRGWWLTYLVSGVLMFIGAPVFFPIVIVPAFGVGFRFSLHKSMSNNQE